MDPSAQLRCKYGSVFLGILGRHKSSRKRFVEISFVEGSKHPAARHNRRIFHLLPGPNAQENPTSGPFLFPWPDRLLDGLKKHALPSADQKLAMDKQPHNVASIVTKPMGQEECPGGDDIFLLLRPNILSISNPECADLLFMCRGKRNENVGTWPYAYDRPRRKKGKIDTWQNGGGKRSVLKWTLTGLQAGDVLERRAGKIVQADPSLPVLKYHQYVVTRDRNPIGCHLFHVCPTNALIPASMLASQTLHRSTPASLLCSLAGVANSKRPERPTCWKQQQFHQLGHGVWPLC